MHPGNVLIRPATKLEDLPVIERAKRRFMNSVLGLGDYNSLPEIIFLDAGLAATMEPPLNNYIQDFFVSMLQYDGKGLAT